MPNHPEIRTLTHWHTLLQQAEDGDGHAMTEVALWYENGLSIDDTLIVETDLQLAFSWTKKAYEAGDIAGTERYANYLSEIANEYCQRDTALAMQLYERAMQAGSPSAARNLALEYRNKQQFDKAFLLYQQAAPEGSLIVGQCYYYGIGTAKDRLKAFEIFVSLSTDNSTPYEVDEANYLIGRCYLDGEVVEQSWEKARHYLQLADSDGDHRSAQELLILIGRDELMG